MAVHAQHSNGKDVVENTKGGAGQTRKSSSCCPTQLGFRGARAFKPFSQAACKSRLGRWRAASCSCREGRLCVCEFALGRDLRISSSLGVRLCFLHVCLCLLRFRLCLFRFSSCPADFLLCHFTAASASATFSCASASDALAVSASSFVCSSPFAFGTSVAGLGTEADAGGTDRNAGEVRGLSPSDNRAALQRRARTSRAISRQVSSSVLLDSPPVLASVTQCRLSASEKDAHTFCNCS